MFGGLFVRFLNRDSAEDLRSDEDTRLDLPSIASLDRLRPAPTTADLERAERLRADTAQYAAALKQQLDLLVDAYDVALAKWKADHDALEARVEEIPRLEAYVGELEHEVLAAWEQTEQLQEQYEAERRSGAFYQRELEAANRLAADREQRLTLAIFEAQQSQARAEALTQQHASEAATALRDAESAARRAEEHRERADWATDERGRLAKCYEDACLQASQIEKSVEAVEHETSKALAAKDQEIAALTARCVELESTVLEHINASIREARAESERLSALVSGVQQGRFWKLKRAAQRMRGLIRR